MTSSPLLGLLFMVALTGDEIHYCTHMTMKYYVVIFRFSRKLLWLKVAVTNHDPRVIVHHYLDCVKNVGGNIY